MSRLEISRHAGVNELCSQVPELVAEVRVLDIIADRLASRRFELTCRYDASFSVTEWASRLVRVAVRNGPGGMTVLFDLLHELGHVETDQPVDGTLDQRERLRREIIAWDRAEQLLHDFDLDHYLVALRARRAFCLASYPGS